MNIITVNLKPEGQTVAGSLYQYDYGQILRLEGVELPERYEVHFANVSVGGTAYRVMGDADGAAIPDACLTR